MEKCAKWTTRGVLFVKRCVSFVCRLLLILHAATACIVVVGQAALSHPVVTRHTPFAYSDLVPYQKHIVFPWVMTTALFAVVTIGVSFLSAAVQTLKCMCAPCTRCTRCTRRQTSVQTPQPAEKQEKDAPPKGSGKTNKLAVRQRRSFAVLHTFTKTN